ncbi:MAG: methyltransferase domain-containing protein [Cyanobacteria bacterium P01_A01_bin.84]
MPQNPIQAFQSEHYLNHNQKRLEHLASLGLDIHNSSVLEVGAGIGDHTGFFLERGCEVLSTEPRLENLQVLQSRHKRVCTRNLDLEKPPRRLKDLFDIVYCYGTLYHLSTPREAIDFMARHCRKFLLLETCVSSGNGEYMNLCKEYAEDMTQSISGKGCRPTRKWIYSQLKRHFEFVYMPITQPNHQEFPLDWTSLSSSDSGLLRSIFIASRYELNNSLLVEEIPMKQRKFQKEEITQTLNQ